MKTPQADEPETKAQQTKSIFQEDSIANLLPYAIPTWAFIAFLAFMTWYIWAPVQEALHAPIPDQPERPVCRDGEPATFRPVVTHPHHTTGSCP